MSKYRCTHAAQFIQDRAANYTVHILAHNAKATVEQVDCEAGWHAENDHLHTAILPVLLKTEKRTLLMKSTSDPQPTGTSDYNSLRNERSELQIAFPSSDRSGFFWKKFLRVQYLLMAVLQRWSHVHTAWFLLLKSSTLSCSLTVSETFYFAVLMSLALSFLRWRLSAIPLTGNEHWHVFYLNFLLIKFRMMPMSKNRSAEQMAYDDISMHHHFWPQVQMNRSTTGHLLYSSVLWQLDTKTGEGGCR